MPAGVRAPLIVLMHNEPFRLVDIQSQIVVTAGE